MSAAVAEAAAPVGERFFGRLQSLPGPRAVLALLTHDEAVRLRAAQADHFRHLMEPDLDDRSASASAERLGRVHSMVGVEIDWFASAMGDFEQSIFDVMPVAPALRDDVEAVVRQRVSNDLRGAMAGYRQLLAGQARALSEIGRIVVEAGTVTDLMGGVVAALTAMDGVAAALFGRPDESGRLQFEAASGDGIDALDLRDPWLTTPITTGRGEATGRGPSGRAWRSQSIERADSYLTDRSTEPWREVGVRFGWRSSAAIPLVDGRGASRAIVSVYSPWPNFFAYSTRAAFLAQLKQLLEPALARLESRQGAVSGVRAMDSRRESLASLAHGDVVMHFQPVVSLQTGHLLKLEALARLRVGDELVGPAQFLPALGERELMRLFDVGLDQALSAARRWEAQGLLTGVSVNLPAYCLSDPGYVACVERALATHGVEGPRLTLELLETGHADNEPQWNLRMLQQMKGLGVLLAEDDLGSGQSSLLRLQAFDFDEVKLDQQLIRGTAASPSEISASSTPSRCWRAASASAWSSRVSRRRA